MKFVLFSILLMLISPRLGSSQSQHVAATEEISRTFADDYQKDAMLTEDIGFGIKVGDDFWHVIAKAKTTVNNATVTLFAGEPPEASFYFKTDFETLVKINNGELNALTGSAKAFDTDFAPFDADCHGGFSARCNVSAETSENHISFLDKGNT